jgi:hypothetical protein
MATRIGWWQLNDAAQAVYEATQERFGDDVATNAVSWAGRGLIGYQITAESLQAAVTELTEAPVEHVDHRLLP